MEAHLIPVAVAARVLQLRDGAALTQKDVKDAYRSKALELHPDRNRDDPQSAAREFKLVKRCYEVAMRAASHQEVVAANAAGRGAWKESMGQPAATAPTSGGARRRATGDGGCDGFGGEIG